jgi:hypothetical protein
VKLSYHWFQGTTEVVHDGLKTSIPSNLDTNQSVQLDGKIKAPQQPGTYTLKWDMIEGSSYFTEHGVPTGNQQVTVTD